MEKQLDIKFSNIIYADLYGRYEKFYGINNVLLVVESLLIMSKIGVQLKTTFASGRTSCSFICCSQIRDIIINEAVTMVSVSAH